MVIRIVRILFFICASALAGAAMAQADPTLNQVYEAAQAGRIAQAQDMMKQVLRDHPQSAKAHYVEAELLARQQLFAQARQELATAQSLAPGLPFARPSAVRALREELEAMPSNARPTEQFSLPSAPAGPTSSFPWGWALGLAGVAAVWFAVMRSRRPAASAMPPASYVPPVAPGAPTATGYGQPGYGQPGYGQAAPGMGSNLMGGLATGLAAGAGIVAAEQIGRRLFGSEHAAGVPLASQEFKLDPNEQMGGDNFGITGDAGWDDGGSVDPGGGWDS